MSTVPPVNVSDFLINAPFCQKNVNFEHILTLLQTSDHSHIVVINEKSAPVGLIDGDNIRHCLTNIFLSRASMTEFSLLSPIHHLIDTMINIVSADTSIRDFLPLLQGDRPQVFIIIDHRERYLGLVNQNHLLRFITEYNLSISEQLISLQNECQQLTARNIDLIQMLHWRNQLLASWSHQLKSPVTALVALSNLLQEKKIGQLNERQTNYAQQIYHSSRQLMGLLSLTIDLTYVESGKLILKSKPLDIKKFCQELCQNLPDNISIDIDINIDIEPSLKMMVADHFHLNQILHYLLRNALDFTPSDGKIGLKVEAWCNWITFTVWHNGCGIVEENQPFLFEECQPLDNPLTGYFQGTGLELILSQRLAFAHGGDISFISRIDQGSAFTVLLPPVFPPSIYQDKIYNFRLILIVETDVILISNLAEYLQKLNYYVIVARTEIEAYRKAHQLKPNFIFLSINLDTSFDFTIFKLLKSDSLTKDITIFKTKHESDGYYFSDQNFKQDLPINMDNLSHILSKYKDNNKKIENLILLLLAPISIDFEVAFSRYASQFNYRVISCNSLKQAFEINKLWSLNIIILDGRSAKYAADYWIGLQENHNLVKLPLITLDIKITSTINKMNKFKVFPYLALSESRDLGDLFEVINIACQE
jgi:signal transduction histidine kinase